MKRFSASLVIISLCLVQQCNATKHVKKLPRLRVVAPVLFDVEENPIIEDDKMIFINSLVEQVWNEDFGKFTELFYKHHFRLLTAKRRGLETFSVTEETLLTVEKTMGYLYRATTENCLDFFRCWIDFYKNFRCTQMRKKIIFESFKEFVCRFLIEISKSFYVTNELLRRKTAIMCELYGLEDKKTLSLL